MIRVEALEPRTCLSAVTTGATITADQAAIQTAATACDTAKVTLYSVVGTDDGAIYAAAGGITAKKSLALLAKAKAFAAEGVALLSSDLDTLTGGALSATAAAANDGTLFLANVGTGVAKVLVRDEKALAASVGRPAAHVDGLLAQTNVDGLFKALRAAEGTNAQLRTAIDQRLADSASLRKALVEQVAALKLHVTAFAKDLTQLHGG